MHIRYRVELTEDEREHLLGLTSSGQAGARMVKRANILLMSDGGEHTEAQIEAALRVSRSTIYRVKRDFVEEGLTQALTEQPRSGGPRKLTPRQEGFLIATACSPPPKGRSRWTLHLLADQLVVGTELASVSTETVRRRLADNELKPWQKKMWCIRALDAEFVAQMEHILDLYGEAPDPARPVVNFDEALKQMVADTREPVPMQPGQPERVDYEYKRAGTANIYLFFDRHRRWRHAKATNTKTHKDFAECMRDLVDVHYPDAECIRVVMDNLNTHKPASLYQAFAAPEARRILRRLEFHYTPRHASWLNMVEIEIGVMNRMCLDRRIPDFQTLESELLAWETARNQEGATIKWLFDVDTARVKLHRAYDGLNASELL